MSIFLFCGSFLLSQSLVDVAKKEKERRERLKGRTSKIVTNKNLRRVPKEETAVSVQSKTPPQKSPETISTAKIPVQKAPTAKQLEISDQADQIDTSGYIQNYATKLLASSSSVRNPEFALEKPDGRYAEIPIFGTLDLEFNAKNGPGTDILIYAKQEGAKELMPGGEEETGIPIESFIHDYVQGFWYGVLGMEERGEWVEIGRGSGRDSPEEFDIGSLHAIKRLRIIFAPHNNADPGVRLYKMQPGESLFVIDAVESLHR